MLIQHVRVAIELNCIYLLEGPLVAVSGHFYLPY